MHLELDPSIRQALPEGEDPFEWFLQAQGLAHREVKHRLTYEVRLGGHHIFVKRHLGCGWKEVLKEWYRLRKPVVSARTEWEAAEALTAAGVSVPRVLGQGERGRYPHAIESFVVLEALEDRETLEHFKPGWMEVLGHRWVTMKRTLTAQIAEMVHRMHGAGINHRDLYINHFLIAREAIQRWQPGEPIQLYLIDLHRAQQRDTVPSRWLIKDLGSLLFSALDAGLTSADCAHFLRIYLGTEWRSDVRRNRQFWKAVCQRSVTLYRDFHKKPPELPRLLRD